MWLTRTAINRPALVTMVFLFFAVIGLILTSRMAVNLMPDMSYPNVSIITPYPGAGPKEVESMVSKPMEDAVMGINNLKSVRSSSREGSSMVFLEFEMDADPEVAINEVQRVVAATRRKLPDNIEEPRVARRSSDDLPILRLSVTGDLPAAEFFDMVKNDLMPRIQQVEGVSQVTLIGGVEREIRIEVDGRRLKPLGLSITDVTAAIAADNMDAPAGSMYGPNRRFTTRVTGKITNLRDFAEIPVPLRGGGWIKTGDIARISDGHTEDVTYSKLNGVPSVGIIITKQSKANAVSVVRDVKAQMDKIMRALPGNPRYSIAQDLSQFTWDSIRSVGFNLLEALLMVALVLLVFLHSMRSSFIVLLAIPISMITAMIFLFFSGASINLITLMALGLVIGILVDDSIVVLENIFRHLHMGKTPRRAALDGRSEIGLAAISITLVDVVVFVPIFFATGQVGKTFREFAITVVASTLVSLLVSFTLTPMLASRWLKSGESDTNKEDIGRFGIWFENWFERRRENYRGILAWALGHRKTIVAVAAGALVVGYAIMKLGFVPGEFMPAIDRGEFSIEMDLPPGTLLEKSDSIGRDAEAFVRAQPEVERVGLNVGFDEGGNGADIKSYRSQVLVRLVPKEMRKVSTDQFMVRVEKFLSQYPDLVFQAQSIGLFGTADRTPISYEIRGTNLDTIQAVANRVTTLLRSVPGTRDVQNRLDRGLPEQRILVDRAAAASHAVSVNDVTVTMQNYLTGVVATQYDENDRRYDARVLLRPEDRDDPDLLPTLPLRNRLGEMIELGTVAKIGSGTGPAVIQRRDRLRTAQVSSELRGRALGDVMAEFERRKGELNLPRDVSLRGFGDVQNYLDMLSSMTFIFILAIIFVFMVMVALFESYAHPFTIMFAIPTAFVGSLIGLALTGKALGMVSFMGIIMTIGLVTKNAILLVDFTNTLRARGKPLVDALIEAGGVRFRPIIMTTATMVTGMAPLALASGPGSELRSPIGIVLVFGLITSLFLTLVLVPVIYTYVEGLRGRLGVKESFHDALAEEQD